MNSPIIVQDRLIEPIVEDEIRLRAYDLFLRRGKGDGHAMDTGFRLSAKLFMEYSLPYSDPRLTRAGAFCSRCRSLDTLIRHKTASMSGLAFHEKAGRSQVGFGVFLLDKVFSPAE